MTMPIELGRPSVRSSRGIVATSQRYAAQVGADVLERGGNAADSAIATAAALAVTEPCSCGLGGDCFVLYFDAESRRVTSLNGSGRSPAALTRAVLNENESVSLAPFSPHTVTVPGAAAAWADLSERHGSLPFADLFAGAITLADGGFVPGPVTSHFWKLGEAMQINRWPGNSSDLALGAAGAAFRNPSLASVLEELAVGGRKKFYAGRVGKAIASAVQKHGGVLAHSDLLAHQSEWSEPISTVHRGLRVFECPPNGQGLTALLALNILSAIEEDQPLEPFDDVRRIHREIEALRLAFADAKAFIADPNAGVPTAALLSKSYAKSRAALIDLNAASVSIESGSPSNFSDTAYLSVVDADGNACSLIFSNYMGFGTGIIPEGCGFTLQNRGHNFSLEPASANALAPSKRPYHTIIPALGLDAVGGDFRVCFGVMGGFMQPQGHLQTGRGLLEGGTDPQSILDRPRFLIDTASDGAGVALEEGFDSDLAEALTSMGHKVRWVRDWQRSAFGRGQMITQENGVLVGGSDPRADGCAIAL